MKIDEIESKVLERVKPDEDERKKVNEVSEELLEAVDRELEGDYKPEVVGSVSKGTYLKDPDIDIFVRFPLSVSRKEMEKKIIKAGQIILDESKERYAEHPYIYGMYKSFEVDIVPCYDMDDISQMKSAVDRTPFHTEYIKERLGEAQKEEAMLLKAYLEGIGAYGAKAEVWGFSGYLCELLISKYGSFKKTIEEVSDWRPGHTIKMVESDKDFDDPLVVIDPVDPDRNVAAPVSKEKFSLFVLSSKRFLNDPELSYFFPNDIEPLEKSRLMEKVQRRGCKLLALRFPVPDVVEDNLYPQVQKCLRRIVHQLSHKDFETIHSDYYLGEKILLIFEFESGTLTNIERHRGPPVWIDNSEDFIDKYGKEVYLDGDRLWVDRSREYTEIKKAMIDVMESIDLGSDINPYLPEKAIFLTEEDLVEEEQRDLTEFFDRRFPWER